MQASPTTLRIKTPSSYVDTNMHMSSSWTEPEPMRFTGAGENPVLFLGSRTQRILLWVQNFFIDKWKYFVCTKEHGNTTNTQCRCCMKVGVQIFPKHAKAGMYVFYMSFPRFLFLCSILKCSRCFRKKTPTVYHPGLNWKPPSCPY